MITKAFRQCGLLLFFLFIIQVTTAQKFTDHLHINGRIRVDNEDPTGAVVTLTNQTTKKSEKSVTVNITGKFELDLSFFSEYRMTVTKENHYTKDIDVSTMIPSQVWAKDSIFPPFLMVVTIYKKVPYVTLSFEGRVVGKIAYSPKGKLDNFDSNIFIDDRDIRKEIDQALKDHEDEIFNQKMAEAVEFEKKNQIREAIHAYEEALALRKNDQFIKPKLKELTSDLQNLEKDASLEADFNRLVATGDENVGKLRYPEAIDNFKAALVIKKGNPVASDKLKNAEQLLAKANAEKAKLDEAFNKLLTEGDTHVSEKKFSEAIDNFKAALQLKTGDKMATDKLANAEQLLAKANADKARLDAEFARLLASGDDNVSKLKFTEGISDFKEALKIRPDDKNATTKLANAEQLYNKLLADKARQEAEFARLLSSGDDNVGKQKYQEGISDFKDALKIKPEDKTATTKLANAEQLLAKVNDDKAKQEAEFVRLLASGDDNVSKQKYPDGIADFKEALRIKPEDKSAMAKLANAEQLLAKVNADKAKQEAEFVRLLASGDDNVSKQKYPDGISDFKDALKIKPEDKTATTKLANAEQLLAKVNADKAKQEAEFVRLLASGDDYVLKQQYPEGITDFKEALKIKPEDKTATAKLANAEQLLAKVNAAKTKQEAEFMRLITQGDEQVNSLKYQEAITSFKNALILKPANVVATEKLSNAEQQLAKVNADKTKREEEFNRLLASGDISVNKQKYQEGILDFKEALKLKSEDKEAISRLANAEKLLAAANANKAQQEAEFVRLLAAGDDNVSQKKYSEGIINFKDALKIKLGDVVANTKLTNAELLLAKVNADKAKLEEDFNRLLASGDINVNKQKYPEGISDFKEALKLKPDDKNAKTKLVNAEQFLAKLNADKAQQEAEFEHLLAAGDEQVKTQKYMEAIGTFKSALVMKPGNEVATEKLAGAEQLLAKANADRANLEADFTRWLALGDENVARQKYADGITNFKEALKIKPDNKIAAARLMGAEQLLAKANADREKLDADFARLIVSGDENVSALKFAGAITNFKGALALKPGNTVAIEKLDHAEKLLAKVASDKAALDADFNRLMSSGDANVVVLKYSEAIENFKGALGLKPEDKVASLRLANAEQLLAKVIADKTRQDAEFVRLLTAGDASTAIQKYPEAIVDFKDALKIKPVDAVALAKLAEAEKLLIQLLAEKQKKEDEARMQAEKQKKYKEAIGRADQLFATKVYPEAKIQYRDAIRISDTEKYPVERIAEIDSLLAQQARERVLAQQHTVEQRKMEDEGSYQKNIQTGDLNFAKSLWTLATFYYEEALKYKSGDKYALDRIESCRKMIDSNISLERMQEYTAYVKHADEDLQAKKFSSSRFYYGKASAILPWEKYPMEQLKLVEKLISSTDVNGIEGQYFDAVKKADDAVVQKSFAVARFYYQKAISLKPEEEYAKQQLKRLSSEN